MRLWVAVVLVVAVVDNCHSSGCFFNHKHYPEGKQLAEVCTTLVCKGGDWIFNGFIHKECASCHVWNDPHFTSFDNPLTPYDWHGQCNYSITQTGKDYRPIFSVYGEFNLCLNGMEGASCLYKTTFTNFKHSIITFERKAYTEYDDDTFKVYFNGIPFVLTKVPTLYGVGPDDTFFAWEGDDGTGVCNSNCVCIIGTKGLMIKYCGWEMFILVDKSLKGSLYGLCGYYDDNPATVFTDRDGNDAADMTAFAKSWQVDPLDVCTSGRRQSGTKCEDYTSFDEYRQDCADNIGELDMLESDRNITIESCAFDRCIIIDSESTEPSPDDWLRQSKKSAERIVLMRSIEKDITDPTATAAIEAQTPPPKQPTTVLPTLPPTTVLPTQPPTSTTTKLTTQAATHLPTLKPSPSDLAKQNVIVQIVQRVGP